MIARKGGLEGVVDMLSLCFGLNVSMGIRLMYTNKSNSDEMVLME